MNPLQALKDHPMLARYQQVKAVGRGAFGVVFQALDPRLQRKVAIKLLLIGEDQNVLRRFQREAEAQARIQSQHVVRLFASDFDVHPPGVVLEWVGGGNLLDLAQKRDRPPHPAEVRQVARDLLQAIADVHAAGLVHRDVKPANVFLRDDGRAMLGDLGLVGDQEMASTLSKTGVALGTPKYMPPEVMRGERWAPSGDFFGVGLSLWEYATRVHPNVYFNHSLMMFLEPDLRLPTLEQAGAYRNPPLQALVDALLDVDPDKRPADVELALELLGDEDDAAAGDDAAVAAWSPPERDREVTLEGDRTLRPATPSQAETRGQVPLDGEATYAGEDATKERGAQTRPRPRTTRTGDSATRAVPVSRAIPARSLATVPPPSPSILPRVLAALAAGGLLLGGGILLSRGDTSSDASGPADTLGGADESREFPADFRPEPPAVRYLSPDQIELTWESPVKAYAKGGARTPQGVVEFPRGRSASPVRLLLDAPAVGSSLRELRIQLVDREGNEVDAAVPPTLTLRSLPEHARALLEAARAGADAAELRRLWEPLRTLHVEGGILDYDASLHAELEAATATL